MILPTKRLGERALIHLGADALRLLAEPKTVSRVWHQVKRLPQYTAEPASITYDWFVLALDLLFLMDAIKLEDGRLRRANT